MPNKWYENEKLMNLSKRCDDAFFSQSESELSLLVDECYTNAHDLSNDATVRARYFYIAFTTHGNLIDLKVKNTASQNVNYTNVHCKAKTETRNLFETYHQKSLYLARNAFEILQSEKHNNEDISAEDYAYMKYMQLFEWQLNVNYANFFYQKGRFVKATELLNGFDTKIEFPMGTAQLGMKLYELSRYHYDQSHQKILLYKAYHYIRQASESEYPEKEEMVNLINIYMKNIISIVGQDFLDKQLAITDFICPHKEKLPENETTYREWTACHKLSLNILNDVFSSLEVGYDPLLLPTMTEKLDSSKVQNLFGLFNQIKQEYTSARFLAYEGLAFREPHFSDKSVYLINTLDYPVYGLGIEKIKACYRAVYSIFDKISFFLNEYFEIGIDRSRISYYRLFSPKKNVNDKIKIIDLAENNQPLCGLWWIFKDVRNINIDANGREDNGNSREHYKHIDSVMNSISDVRNAMEHGYLKVLDFYCKESSISDNNFDQLAYKISFKDFEELTLQLLKYVREAIILLVFSVKRAEEIKESERKTDEILLPMFADIYDDDWKQIF